VQARCAIALAEQYVSGLEFLEFGCTGNGGDVVDRCIRGQVRAQRANNEVLVDDASNLFIGVHQPNDITARGLE
jgi:hypothetical protein